MTAMFTYITETGTVESIFEQGLDGGRKQARKWMAKQATKWEREGYVVKEEGEYEWLFLSGLGVRTVRLVVVD